MRNANTAFMVTPARITIVRFHTGWRSNARAGSIGMADFPPSTPPATPSSSSPAIFTYPPSGSHESQYSVSPRRQLKMGDRVLALVAAARWVREPVLGLPAPPAENGTPEADREPQHLNPHGLRREEVAHFVNEDQRTEDDDERGEIQEHAASRARRRASASAASTVSSDAASRTWSASSPRAMVSAIRPNRIPPSRNSSTATSFAALNAVGAVPPAAAAARPSPRSEGVV